MVEEREAVDGAAAVEDQLDPQDEPVVVEHGDSGTYQEQHMHERSSGGEQQQNAQPAAANIANNNGLQESN